jgi:hypothetical protein
MVALIDWNFFIWLCFDLLTRPFDSCLIITAIISERIRKFFLFLELVILYFAHSSISSINLYQFLCRRNISVTDSYLDAFSADSECIFYLLLRLRINFDHKRKRAVPFLFRLDPNDPSSFFQLQLDFFLGDVAGILNAGDNARFLFIADFYVIVYIAV